MGCGLCRSIQHGNHFQLIVDHNRVGFLDPTSQQRRWHHHFCRALWNLLWRSHCPYTSTCRPNSVRTNFVPKSPLNAANYVPRLMQILDSDVHEIGVWTGTLYGILGLITATSTLSAGAIVDDQGGNFLGLKIFCGAAIALGFAFLICARISLKGWGLKTKV